jgi:hypothetical protein
LVLYFLKVYPKQSRGCWVVGASAGAVDPKMHCKWGWAFIDDIANLVDIAVVFYTHNVGWCGLCALFRR